MYELVELFAYADTPELFKGDMLMFSVAACAVFSYAKIIQDAFLKFELGNGFNFTLDPDMLELDTEEPEEVSLVSVFGGFFYDNIFAYLCCVIMYNAYMPLAAKFNGVFAGDSFWDKAIAVAVIILFLIIPAIPQVAQFMLYIISVSLMEDLLDYIYFKIDIPLFFRAVFTFLAAAVLVFLIKIILSAIGELVMKKFKLLFLQPILSILGSALSIIGTLAAIFVGMLAIILLLSKCSGG